MQFVDGTLYEYTEASAGREAVATMQRLARAGAGLGGCLAREVRERHARKSG